MLTALNRASVPYTSRTLSRNRPSVTLRTLLLCTMVTLLGPWYPLPALAESLFASRSAWRFRASSNARRPMRDEARDVI